MAKKKETAEQEQFRLEEAFDRIEALLEKLQDKDVTLEESFGLYQEGMGLLKLCNENIDHVEKQMLHTYSLVHDDLPAMDNDEYRRGKLTTHAKFGHAMGVLAGDALLNYAFETAAEAFDKSTDLRRTAKALQILSRKAGIYGMIGGQVVDVQSSGHAIDQDRLDFIYELKTGALLEAAMMVGAVLAGASEEEVSVIEKVASDVGIAFQIRDDILDVTSTLEELGKPIHSDDKNEKTTYVTLKGLKQAEKDVEEISARAIEGLASLPYKDVFLTELIKSLVYREK